MKKLFLLLLLILPIGLISIQVEAAKETTLLYSGNTKITNNTQVSLSSSVEVDSEVVFSTSSASFSIVYTGATSYNISASMSNDYKLITTVTFSSNTQTVTFGAVGIMDDSGMIALSANTYLFAIMKRVDAAELKVETINENFYSASNVKISLLNGTAASAHYTLNNGDTTAFNLDNSFTAEGLYAVTVTDSKGKVHIAPIFTIDKTAPILNLEGMNYVNLGDGINGFGDNIIVTYSDNFGLESAKYTKNNISYNLTNGITFNTSGIYTITLVDLAGNTVTEKFQIF